LFLTMRGVRRASFPRFGQSSHQVRIGRVDQVVDRAQNRRARRSLCDRRHAMQLPMNLAARG